MLQIELHDKGATPDERAVRRQVWWPVTIKVPQDGGTVAEQTCKMLFQLGDNDNMIDMAKLSETKARQYVESLVLDWEGIVDQYEQPIPCTKQNKAAVLRIPYVLVNVVVAWRGACIGAPAKN